jgi:hypothetical protein
MYVDTPKTANTADVSADLETALSLANMCNMLYFEEQGEGSELFFSTSREDIRNVLTAVIDYVYSAKELLDKLADEQEQGGNTVNKRISKKVRKRRETKITVFINRVCAMPPDKRYAMQCLITDMSNGRINFSIKDQSKGIEYLNAKRAEYNTSYNK